MILQSKNSNQIRIRTKSKSNEKRLSLAKTPQLQEKKTNTQKLSCANEEKVSKNQKDTEVEILNQANKTRSYFGKHRTLVPMTFNSKQKKLKLTDSPKKYYGNANQQNDQQIKTTLPSIFSHFKKSKIEKENVQPQKQIIVDTQFQKIQEFDPVIFKRQMKKSMGLLASSYFTCQKTINLVVDPTLKNQSDADTQTDVFTTDAKQYQEYIRFRRLHAKSFQQVQKYFDYIRQMGEKGRAQIEEREKHLNNYTKEGPTEDRQKRVYELMESLQQKQRQVAVKMENVISTQVYNEQKVNRIIHCCHDQINETFGSIQRLLKVFKVKFQKSGQSNYKRIADRISTQIKYTFSKMENTVSFSLSQMNQVNNFKIVSSPWRSVASSFYSWHKQNQEQKMLIRNCVNKILILPVTTYQLFGNAQNQLFYNYKNYKEVSQQKCLNPFFKKCQDCQQMMNKVKYIHFQNNVLLPIIKVLNQLIKDRKSTMLKQELKITQIPEPVPEGHTYESIYIK